jgi:hypothetical protein
MPDENEQTGVDEEDLPKTPLHAHGSGIEETGDRPREDDAEGEILDDDQDSADEATNTGGATSGGPPREDPGEDPSRVEHDA